MEDILAKALGADVTQMAPDEKQQLLARLLGRLAHEIRNPLSSLDIHVQLLEEDLGEVTAEIRDKLTPRLGIIRGELHRLENIVKHFLRLSGLSELNIEATDLRQVAGHVCELLRPEAQAREIQVVVECAANLPPLIMADAGQLTQALLNLLINALQAVERQGRIVLRVENAAGVIAFQVRDSGPGVVAPNLTTIFEPYFTTKPDGTGLGLWIAQQIARAHGGDIVAANAPEGGAIFTLRVPARAKEPAHG
jgi:two-component system sensor histidine kinase HydH